MPAKLEKFTIFLLHSNVIESQSFDEVFLSRGWGNGWFIDESLGFYPKVFHAPSFRELIAWRYIVN